MNGSYFEFNLDWHRARNDKAYINHCSKNSKQQPQILWLYYEDIQENPQAEIRKIISFLGFDKQIKSESQLNTVVSNSSFHQMKQYTDKGKNTKHLPCNFNFFIFFNFFLGVLGGDKPCLFCVCVCCIDCRISFLWEVERLCLVFVDAFLTHTDTETYIHTHTHAISTICVVCYGRRMGGPAPREVVGFECFCAASGNN